MSEIDEMMVLYKEIQENYIKALERENEELRKQREKDSLKIEELEKHLLEERNNNYIKHIPQPTPFDDKTVIGPGNGWGYSPNPIWTSNKTSPVTYQYDTTSNPTYGGTTGSAANDVVGSLRQAYHDMTGTIMNTTSGNPQTEHRKFVEWMDKLRKMQKEVEDDN